MPALEAEALSRIIEAAETYDASMGEAMASIRFVNTVAAFIKALDSAELPVEAQRQQQLLLVQLLQFQSSFALFFEAQRQFLRTVCTEVGIDASHLVLGASSQSLPSERARSLAS